MRILFLSLVRIDSLKDRGIYHDLLHEFHRCGHEVYVVCPAERRSGLKTRLIKQDRLNILQVRSLNIQKTSLFEKALGTLTLNYLFDKAISKYFSNVSLDIILYTTPPITLSKLIKRLKKDSSARTYLLLKDIFPQNAIDMKLMKKGSLTHRVFRQKEKRLYAISDKIGCMSPANVEYIKRNNPGLSPEKIEVNPNSIDTERIDLRPADRSLVLKKYNIDHQKTVFIYGGNLGKPQGIDFLLKVIDQAQTSVPDAFFVIAGSGTAYAKIESHFASNHNQNALLLSSLKTDEYNLLASCCDIGLVSLHHDFTIPNFPSRVLSYMQNRLPVLCITDDVTDMGSLAAANHFGLSCSNRDIDCCINSIKRMTFDRDELNVMGQNGFEYLKKNYDVRVSYSKIMQFAHA